jgi:hypothetical protein
MNGERTIKYEKLIKRLRELYVCGVKVPELNITNKIPEYFRTIDNIEFYHHDGEDLPVKPGHVIDDTHGNVVYLADLESKLEIY